MAGRNGYFQVIVKGDGTYLHIIPAEEGGEKLSVKETADYLERKDFYFDILELDDAISEERDMELFLSPEKAIIEREMMIMNVSPDAMLVTARFYAPFKGGELINREELLYDLEFNGIVFGIDYDSIDAFLRDRNYCTDIVLAKGKPFIDSTDGKIDYLFNTNPSGAPKLNEDGTVDYHDIENITECTVGELLAVKTPPDPGVAGSNVRGEEMRPTRPADVQFKHNEHCYVAEDGLELLSNINGYVVLEDDKVVCKNVLQLVDVDMTTGNISFDGNIEISGNVMAGFSVSATGDVDIKGFVEGSDIRAGGRIIVSRGMNGMNKGFLEAEGDIYCRFIENATVSAGGKIDTGAIIHSTVSSGKQVVVEGKKGFIIGGTVRATDMIEAKELGSETGVTTVVEVGADPRLRRKIGDLQRDNAATQKNIDRLEPMVRAFGERLGRGEHIEPEQMAQAKDYSEMIKRLKFRIKSNNEEIEKINQTFRETRGACVKVRGRAWPGTKVVISEGALAVKSNYDYCRFALEDDEVVLKPF